MRVTEVRDPNQWDSFSSQWQELYRACDPQHPFLDWHWNRLWLERMVHEGNAPILILAENQEGEVVGIAAFQIKRYGLFSCLEGFAQQFCDYVDWLCLPGCQLEVGDLFYRWIIGQKRIYNLIRIYNIFPEGVAFRTIDRHCPGALEKHSVAPHVNTSGDFEQYLKRLRPKFLSDTRRRERKLEKEIGALEYVTIEQNHQIPGIVNQMVEWVGGRLEAKKQSNYFGEEGMPEHLTRLYQGLNDQRMLHLTGLKANGRMIAINVALKLGNKGLFSYTTAYDPECAKDSVIRLLKMKHVEECFETDCRVYDFCLGGEDYKLEFNPDIRQLYRCTVFGKNAGGMLVKLYLTKGKRLIGNREWVRLLLTGQDHRVVQRDD